MCYSILFFYSLENGDYVVVYLSRQSPLWQFFTYVANSLLWWYITIDFHFSVRKMEKWTNQSWSFHFSICHFIVWKMEKSELIFPFFHFIVGKMNKWKNQTCFFHFSTFPFIRWKNGKMEKWYLIFPFFHFSVFRWSKIEKHIMCYSILFLLFVGKRRLRSFLPM